MKKMRKMKTVHYGLLFMVCMAASLFISTTANAEWDYDDQSGQGLVTADWLEFNDGAVWLTDDNTPATLGEDGNATAITLSSWHQVSLPGESLWIGYHDGTSMKAITDVSKLTLTYWGNTKPGEEGSQQQSSVGSSTLSVDEDNSNLIYFDVDKTKLGYYQITYGSDTKNALTILAAYPEVGFYSTNTLAKENIIDTVNIYEGATTEFYVYLNNLGKSLTLENGKSENDSTIYPFSVFYWSDEEGNCTATGSTTGVENYFSVDSTSLSDGWYKITINTAAENTAANKSFDLQVTAWKTDEDNATGYSMTNYISVKYAPKGLFAIEEGNDEAVTDLYVDDMTFATTFSLQFASIADKTATVTTISSLSNIKLYQAEWVDGSSDEEEGHYQKSNDVLDTDYYNLKVNDDGKIYLKLYREGDFWLEYTNGSDTGHIYIHAYLPGMGLYSTAKRPDSGDEKITTLLGDTTTYKEKQASTVYLLYWEPDSRCTDDEVSDEDDWAVLTDTIKIQAKDSNGKELSTNYVKTKAISGGYAITTTDKMTGDYTVTVTCKLHIHDADDEDATYNFSFICDPITKLQVKTAPTKTTYTEGESFDKTGMVIQGVYSDNSTIALTDYTVTPSGALKTTDKQVTISYNNKKITQAITVTAAAATTTQASATTEAPTTDTPAAETKVGDKAVSGNATYQVTASSDKKEVAYVSTNKAAKKVTIPSTVTIDGTAYTVTSISANAFANQKKLTTVTIPSTVVTIENGAFKNCTKLKKVTIPAKTTSIGKNAFSGCKSLKTITIKSKKITKIGKNAFKGLSSKATIKVPKSKKKAYKKLLKKAGYKGKIK
jgi:hypothetical protein